MLFTALLLVTSCVYDDGDDAQVNGDSMAVELNISTRSITSTSETYEVGSTWENYIDIAGGDYRIYFFTYNPSDPSDAETNNTLISEFQPLEITDINGTDYTRYTLTGEVDKVMAEYSDFKIVVLANWGTYPTVTPGETTIDDIVEGENSTFLADSFLTTDGVSSAHLIPFYGVREYSGVKWRAGWRTILSGDITLLRALAKVEVVMTADSDIDSFDSVSIVHYNPSGYCAPASVYLKSDYDHDYTWDEDFTSSVHLVGGKNSGVTGELRTHVFNHQGTTSAGDVWTIYLPEYDNTGSDYSYIQISVGEVDYQVYFSDYTDGKTSSSADYDIFRNYLYRFSVKVLANHTISVSVNEWEELFDNEYKFNYDEDESDDDD